MSNPPWGTYWENVGGGGRRRYNFGMQDQQATGTSSLPAIANIAYHDNTKMRDLASRVKLSEQSNRVLLEELMKLQQDLKSALRQNEEMVLQEQQERLAMKEKVEAAENMYTKVSMQLLRTEEKVNIEHTTLTSLLSQSKEIERAIAGGEQRSQLKGEQIDRYLSRFRDEISELRQTSEQINSNMRLVGEDLKSFKHRFEMQNSEFANTTQEVKQKIKRIESDSMTAMDNILRKQENRESLEASTSHLKQSVDVKLSELQNSVNEVRRKSDVEASERRAADQQAQLNVDKVHVSIRELETKYQEIMHTSNLNMREKQSNFESDKNMLAYKMAELVEEQNKKSLQREMQLQEDAQTKFAILEKKLQEEQASRFAFEKSVRNEMENILESLKLHLSDELQSMRQNAKLTQVHGDQSLVKINECVTLLEGEIEAGKKAFEEVLHAEIVARQTQNEKTVNQCNELQDKLTVVVATLQQAIAGLTTQTQDAVEKVKKDIFFVLDQSGDSGLSGLADIDSRLTNLNKHIAEVEESLESRLNNDSSAGNNDYEKLNKKVERTHKWQEVAEKTLKELSIKIQPLNGEIISIKDAIEDIHTEMETQRIEHLGNLDVEENSDNPMPDGNVERKIKKMQDELGQVSSQLEKLDHTVNTLRAVLSQKIASEAKTVELHRDVFSADIEKLVNYFMKEQRRVFVKQREMDAKVYRADVEKDGSDGAHSIHLALLSINRWGLYGAYKMLKLKAAWFKVAEKKNKTRSNSNTYINYDNDGKIKEEDKSEKEESDNESEEEKEDEESEEESEESENESEEEEESEKSEEESEEEKSEKEENDESEKEETDKESEDDEKPAKKPKPSNNNGKSSDESSDGPSSSDKGTDKRKDSKGK